MNVAPPADPDRAEECGALLWERLADGSEVFLVQQLYNVAILRSNSGTLPDFWNDRW